MYFDKTICYMTYQYLILFENWQYIEILQILALTIIFYSLQDYYYTLNVIVYNYYFYYLHTIIHSLFYFINDLHDYHCIIILLVALLIIDVSNYYNIYVDNNMQKYIIYMLLFKYLLIYY